MKELLEIKKAWEATINAANMVFDRIIQEIEGGETTGFATDLSTEHTYPFTADTSIFIGKKPVAVLFGEERAETDNWRKVYSAIIARCNADAKCHDSLMYLRDKVAGRDRALLSRSPGGMRRHVKIDEDMYAEVAYGIATLLYILRDRILAPARFDYSAIRIAIRG